MLQTNPTWIPRFLLAAILLLALLVGGISLHGLGMAHTARDFVEIAGIQVPICSEVQGSAGQKAPADKSDCHDLCLAGHLPTLPARDVTVSIQLRVATRLAPIFPGVPDNRQSRPTTSNIRGPPLMA